MPFDLSIIGSIVAAAAALGAASSGLVDATKVFGGVSLCGLSDLEKALKPLFAADPKDPSTPTAYVSILENLKANWINGVPLEEQKVSARIMVKLSLNANTAPTFASATGVSADVLTELAVALTLGAVLTKEETDTLNLFETSLELLLNRAFQRADQRYRSSAQFLAGAFALILAIIGGAILSSSRLNEHTKYWSTGDFWLAIMAGLLAMPLAPIFKDIASAVHAGSTAARKFAAK